MNNFFDKFLSKITMYRLVLYYLIALLVAAVVFCFFGLLPFKPLDLVFSTLILVIVSMWANYIFAKIFKVPANVESTYITALILALIITPPAVAGAGYLSGLMFLFWAGVLSMAVKYLVALFGKHFFNPAAFAVAVTAIATYQSASWWVGTLYMLPLVVIGGLLLVKKIQRFDLVFSFLGAALVSIIVLSPSWNQPFNLLYTVIVHSPILFFAFVMLTEPLTTPPTKFWRIGYGIITGLVFSPNVHIGQIYSTPELALLVGNVFSYIVSPKVKYLLTLKSKEQIGSDIINFVFKPNHKLSFRPGQYWEWTADHDNPDSRGNRRYFTIASSPTENRVSLGVKFYDQPSSFKKSLLQMRPGDQILAGQLAGDFTLPKDPKKKLVFIAGGIGITPFRSMLKYMIDKNDRRDVVLFYSNKLDTEVAYTDVLVEANEKLGIRTVLTLTDLANIPKDWTGHTGYVNAEMMEQEVADYLNRTYYISGPHGMVIAFEKTLKDMGIPSKQIVIDFFPGFA